MRTGDISAFKHAYRIARATLRQRRRCTKMRLIYSNGLQAFYKYVNHETANSNYRSEHLCNNDGIVLNDQEATDALSLTLLSNFSPNHNSQHASTRAPAQSLHEFACIPALIVDALHCWPISSSCPDSIPFKLIKAVAKSIIRPLNILFQHSLFEGTFPSVWKTAVVIPLYKGRGAKSSPENYRSISLG